MSRGLLRDADSGFAAPIAEASVASTEIFIARNLTAFDDGASIYVLSIDLTDSTEAATCRGWATRRASGASHV